MRTAVKTCLIYPGITAEKPVRPEIHQLPPQRDCLRHSADGITRFEDRDPDTALCELIRGGQSGRATTNYRN
jgi:hypothetical protein